MTNIECNHDAATSTRLAGDLCPSAWECSACGHLTPFTEADFVFHAEPWTPPRPAGVSAGAWLFASRESKFAHYAR